MESSCKTSLEVPSVTCGMCVAIAIVKQHSHCLCALLQRGHLRSDLFWLPALHLIKNEVEPGLRMSPDRKLHRFLETCTSICEIRSSEITDVSISKECTTERAVRFTSCDHLVLTAPEDENKLDENPIQTAFLPFSLTRLALKSPCSEIRELFIQNSGLNMNNMIRHISCIRLRPNHDNPLPELIGPLQYSDFTAKIITPVTILIKHGFFNSLKILADSKSLDLNRPFYTSISMSNRIQQRETERCVFGSALCWLYFLPVHRLGKIVSGARMVQFEQLIELGADVNASVDPVEFPSELHRIRGIPRPFDALDCAGCLSGRSADCFRAVEILIECGLMNFGTSVVLDTNTPHAVLVLVTNCLLTKYFLIKKFYSEKNWEIFQGLIANYRRLESEIRGLYLQLLSLGFGRGPPEFETDPELIIEKECIELGFAGMSWEQSQLSFKTGKISKATEEWLNNSQGTERRHLTELLKEIVARFESPLSLRELARNRIRYAIGGVRFKVQVSTLHLPEALKSFVIECPFKRNKDQFTCAFVEGDETVESKENTLQNDQEWFRLKSGESNSNPQVEHN